MYCPNPTWSTYTKKTCELKNLVLKIQRKKNKRKKMGPGKERKKKKKIGLQCGIVFADESGIEKEKEKKKRLFFCVNAA